MTLFWRPRASRRSQALAQAAVAGPPGEDPGPLRDCHGSVQSGMLSVRLMRGLESAHWPDLLGAVYRYPADLVAGTPDRADLLTGRWLGHAVHPALTTAVLGMWSSASTLDLIGGRAARPAARRLIGMGLLMVPATAATGLAEWRRTDGADRRVGAVHAACNSLATAVMVSSYLHRRRCHRTRAVLTGLLGNLVAGVAAYLGGHLTTVRHVASSHPQFDA